MTFRRPRPSLIPASTWARCAGLIVVALLSSPIFGGEPSDLQYERDVRPLLEQYCFRCHGPESDKGDVNLSTFNDLAAVQRDPKLWQTVLRQLHERVMPPASKPQPTPDERAKLEGWLRQTLWSIDPATLPKDPGRVTIRRLNRAEYNNTVRDLLGVTSRPADAFPTDGGGGGGFDNNADTLFVPPILLEQYLAAATKVVAEAPADRIFIARPGGALPKRDAARKVIEHVATRAFRRSATGEEVDRVLALFDVADRRGDTFDDAVRLALRGVLVSPNFLFKIESDRTDATEPYPIGQYELASRLSYFVWSSMPDDELMQLAREGRLHEEAVLDQQVRRMLSDPRSRALAENFGTQWLDLRSLKTIVEPDRGRFPQYTDALRDAMYEEAVLLVDSVFRDDASLLKLIDADYTFVNEELARHYGLPEVKGAELRRVTLPDARRGGVLGLGAVHAVTSYPHRTSPVLRGEWVLGELLGAPPPPPPPDVTRLPEAEGDNAALSLRQRLEKHRADPTCASCHDRIDPIGFGLENFDAIGRWRDSDDGRPVDSAGVLTTGEAFNGPGELKKVLASSRRPQFVRNVTEKLLAYALGRGVEFYDELTLRQITAKLEQSDFRSAVLVAEIVKSYPFRHRRNAEE